MKYLLAITILCLFGEVKAQVSTERGNLMGQYLGYLLSEMPREDSEGFVKPDSLQLKQWKRMMDLFVAESFVQAEDSLNTHFSNYEMIALTDTSFIDSEYYIIREKSPVVYGWGMFTLSTNYQRDMIVAIPHPEFDSYTIQEGVNMFRYLGGRILVMAGTQRCSNDEAAISDGTTTACSNPAEKFKVSDMAHYDSTAFQIAHESIKELSTNVYAINMHGHNDSSCEDVFLSNGREDDPQPALSALKDSLIAYGIDAGMTGDGSACPLLGTTNVQGRYINGSVNPAEDQPVSNTGYFFHVEQSDTVRRELMMYKKVIKAFSQIIPRSYTTVDLPELPSFVFNEIHAEPTADANNNGSVQTVSDEFVEIVNGGSERIDISGWFFSDWDTDWHQVSSATTLLPNQPLLIFGGNTPTGDFGGAEVQVASGGRLELANSGETIYFKTSAQDTIMRLRYPGGFAGESITLTPDITGTSYTAHSTADTDDNSVFSPGTKINGDPFLPFVEISGNAGWRMLASPTIGLPIRDIAAFNPIQGFGDGHAKNFFTGYNGSSWSAPGSLDDTLSNGLGFIFYFFDNDSAQSSELPLKLRASGAVPTGDVIVDLHSNGDKWNLIGNPFDKGFDFSQLAVNGGSLSSSVGQIYNPDISSYVTTTSINDELASWQGVMVDNNTATSVTFPISATSQSGTLLKSSTQQQIPLIILRASDSNSSVSDQLVLTFSNNASIDWDDLDAIQLPSLSQNAISFSVWGIRDSSEILQTQLSLPLTLDRTLSIPVHISSVGNIEDLFISIVSRQAIPESFSIKIKNKSTAQELLLDSEKGLEILKTVSGYPELLLEISPSQTQAGISNSPSFDFSLNQNYPNPFNPVTILSYSLPETSEVTLSVFSSNGTLIQTLVNSLQNAGNHTFRFDGSSLSSGVYFYKISTRFGIKTGKMMLLK